MQLNILNNRKKVANMRDLISPFYLYVLIISKNFYSYSISLKYTFITK